MTFKDISNIIKKLKYQPDSIIADPPQNEMERAKMHLQNLQEMHKKAYKKRKENWFKEHPDKQFFKETYEEFVRNCTLSEWLRYFVQRIFSRTPEQRFQDEKHPSHGFGHKGDAHSSDGKCREGCRFWPEKGRIEDIEVLKDYK